MNLLGEAGLPARSSLSAGSYVCNHVLYTALGGAGPRSLAGFVHLPWSYSTAPEGSASLADEDLARAVRLVVDHALDDEDDEPGGSVW